MSVAIFELVMDRVFVNADVPRDVLDHIYTHMEEYRLLGRFQPSNRSDKLLTAELEGYPVQLEAPNFAARLIDVVEDSGKYRLMSASERSLEDQDVLRLVFTLVTS
jgi:hypothetical protein